MIVFYKVGLSDGVAQNFFILALCDCLCASASLFNTMGHMARTTIRAFIGYSGVEQAAHIIFQASYYSFAFPENYSIITTVVIAVVRCCCVAVPLKAKHLITVKRQLAAILILSASSTSPLVYVYSPVTIFYVSNSAKNTTLAYFRGAHFQTYSMFNNISY